MTERVEKLQQGGDARGAMRRRVLLAGKLAHDSGAFTHSCVIRDLSTTGARLKIDPGIALPREFYLIDIRAALARDCELAWRKGSEVGVRFVRTVALDPLEDQKLMFLRRLYVDALPR